MRRRLKQLLPWVLSLGFVAYLVLTTDMSKVGNALEHADWLRLVGFMTLVVVLSFVADTATLVPLLRRFVAPTTFREVVAIKGVSYFLNAVNYSLAAGGMAWIFHRKHGVPFLRAFSALIWFFFVDVIALAVMLTFGVLLGRDVLATGPFADTVPIVLAVVWGIVAAAFVYWNLGVDLKVFAFFRKWRIFQIFAEATFRDYLVFTGLRVLFISVYVLMHWLLLPAFGVDIPLPMLLVYTPLITFVIVIPATMSGLGAAQTVMVALFAPHVGLDPAASAAVILAYSTVIGPLMAVTRLLIGYIYMATITRDIVPTEEAIERQRRSEEAGSPPSPGGASSNAVGTSDT